MADQFKTFDKAPIVGVVNVRHWSFAVREIILGVIALSLLVMCLIFVGLYANSNSDSAEHISSPAAIVQKQFCVSRDCMKTAAHSLELLNVSTDPCDNFYQYACGNYKSYNPMTRQASRSIVQDLTQENLDRLEDIISRPPARGLDWAYERKMSDFFQSCQDSYQRERLGGRPFLEKVVPRLGGWDMLGTWDKTRWSLNDALKKVQTDFWVDAFYAPRLEGDANDYSQRVISLEAAGVGKWMYFSWYTSEYTQKQRDDYKKFMKRVASLLIRDAKLVNVSASEQEDRVNQFVNDSFTMEANIAHVVTNSRYRVDPYLDENKVTLTALTRESGNLIDWADQLSYLFNEAQVTGQTRVIVIRREYFRNLTNMIDSLPTADKNRMLHNYLIWRVAEVYVQDMSWEYVHANREIYVDIQGEKNFAGLTKYCMYLVRHYMDDALGALYVQEHLAEESKQKVTDITMSLKRSLQSQLDKTPWFDQQTKAYAQDKLDRVTFKLGYPDWMTNVDAIDNMYNPLNINVSDFFENLFSANNYHRRMWNKLLRFGEDRQQWIYQPYDTYMAVYWYWNEIIAPAGVLQDPLWNHNAPHFSTFGSIGGFLGRYLHYFIDERGANYNKNGDIMPLGETWWSNKSRTDYAPIRKCVMEQYRNVTTNVSLGTGTPMAIPIDFRRYTPTAISLTSGIRLAVKGYQDWMKSPSNERAGSPEKMLPGLAMSPQQMIFLSFAQSHCYNRNEWDKLGLVFRGSVSEDTQVNMALGQLQEFSDAFQCPKGSKMNHKTKCTYY